jgi:hypothetical protein
MSATAAVVATALVAVALALAVIQPAAAAQSRPVLTADVTTTTTTPPTTTTSPTTTTTTSPTTTTTPSTTTSRPPRTTTTTTTTTPTTTTTTTPTAKTSSKTPWGLIALIVVLIVAIVLVVILLRSRRRRGIESEWHRSVVPALSDAQLARASLMSGNAESDDPQVRGAVEVQVERAATALERTVPGAPDPQAGGLATSAAESLRGLAFAIEADRLLRHGTSAPSGVQLAQADEARRARAAELNTALARLSSRSGSGTGSRRTH